MNLTETNMEQKEPTIAQGVFNTPSEMENEILICECNSTEHQIIISYDEEDKVAYCHIHLVHYGFWRRLKAGLKYIFGYKCKFGEWDEFLLYPKHAQKLKELANKLSH